MQELVAANGLPATESESDRMEIGPQPERQPTRRTTHRPAVDITTPKQRRSKQTSASEDSDASMNNALESTVRTKGRSVLRPRGTGSAKKYARHIAVTNPSANATDADADAEDGESEEGIDEQDSPSKQAYLAGLTSRRPAVPAARLEPKDEVACKPPIKAAYYEHIGLGDVWTCPYDDCNERVYDARSATAVRLMEEHFSAKHAESMTDLIKAEMRPYNKVGHLLSRVKDLAAMRELMYDGAGSEDAVDVGGGVVRHY